MVKKNKQPKVKDLNCLNCGYPFQGHEVFCPECGQKNKGKRITFVSFVREVFSGFFSWDAKFWKTLIPLLIAPGKVSQNYIEGKRTRYTNPFRFYLTTSVIFFLLLGLNSKIEEFNTLEKRTNEVKKEEPTQQEADSITNIVKESLNKTYTPINSNLQKRILDEVEKSVKTSTKNKKSDFHFTIAGGTRLDKFQKFHRNNKNMPTSKVLDSLGYEKNFTNRFLYNRAKVLNNTVKSKDDFFKFIQEGIPQGSISLFVLLPIFTFFLFLIYIRKKYTYVEHLIFVFHTQTVFFLLLSIYYILLIAGVTPNIGLFVLLFLIYLFIAMKKFYKQSFFKTLLKFLFLNFVYLLISVFGIVALIFITLTLY